MQKITIRMSEPMAAAVQDLEKKTGFIRQDIIRLALEHGIKILRQQLLPQ